MKLLFDFLFFAQRICQVDLLLFLNYFSETPIETVWLSLTDEVKVLRKSFRDPNSESQSYGKTIEANLGNYVGQLPESASGSFFCAPRRFKAARHTWRMINA